MAEHAERADQASNDSVANDDGRTQAIPSAPSAGSGTPPAAPSVPPTSAQGPSMGYYPDSNAETEHTPKQKKKKQWDVDWAGVKDQVVGFVAGVVRWIGVLFALALVLHIIFVIGDANANNGIVSFIRNWSEWISLGFKDLFVPDDPKLSVLVNYGIAAIFWLVVTAILAKIIRRVGGSA